TISKRDWSSDVCSSDLDLHDAAGQAQREVVVVPDHDDLALRLAGRIVEVIARETAVKGRCVLGLATGSTPLGIYRELIRRHQARSEERRAGREECSEWA